jgi:hypothetical protein
VLGLLRVIGSWRLLHRHRGLKGGYPRIVG